MTTASVIIPATCKVLWEGLKTTEFPGFTTEHWYEVAKRFKKNTYFPHCLGAIDGKHVRVVKPEHSGSFFYNYKQFFSIVLLAVADSEFRFMYIDVGAVGKSADPTVLDESTFGKALLENTLNIPFPQVETEEMGHCLTYLWETRPSV